MHIHKAEHTVNCNDGIVYEVCNCGASRRYEAKYFKDNIIPWHTCKTCTHSYGLKENKNKS